MTSASAYWACHQCVAACGCSLYGAYCVGIVVNAHRMLWRALDLFPVILMIFVAESALVTPVQYIAFSFSFKYPFSSQVFMFHHYHHPLLLLLLLLLLLSGHSTFKSSQVSSALDSMPLREDLRVSVVSKYMESCTV